MESKNQLSEKKYDSLLNIFLNEEDKRGTDLLQMSNYFDVFIGNISEKIEKNETWEICKEFKNFFGRMAIAIKTGFDISKMDMLVASTSHFSKEIIDKLKKEDYHIGESKEVRGQLRPAILDRNERLVKFITLKKAINPTEVLSDISNLAIQISLKNITTQIEKVSRDVREISEFLRREELNNKFIYAKEKIRLASNSENEEREEYLHEADTYLMEGLVALYTDINVEIDKLFKLDKVFSRLKEIDVILTHINEDMQMIPRYVGLRVYLFDFRGKDTEVSQIIEDYCYQLEKWSKKKFVGEKYSALEMIHRYYPYNEENIDFWIEQPKQMLKALHSYKQIIMQKDNDVFYVEVEGEKDG